MFKGIKGNPPLKKCVRTSEVCVSGFLFALGRVWACSVSVGARVYLCQEWIFLAWYTHCLGVTA